MRFFLSLSYFGKAYHGWQRQPNAVTVQEVVEDALSKLLRTPIELVAAGRTDAGVHARELFAHFDMLENVADDLVARLNNFLPDDISVMAIIPVIGEAHARFDAVERTYEYRITTVKDPFLKDMALYLIKELDLEAMNAAAELLMQYEDFKCFSKSNSDVRTFHCQIKEAFWVRKGNQLIFTITADRFLRNMVRAVVGTLLEVGRGRLTTEDVKAIIKSRDRRKAGVSVPAKGLYLTRVRYPESTFNIHG